MIKFKVAEVMTEQVEMTEIDAELVVAPNGDLNLRLNKQLVAWFSAEEGTLELCLVYEKEQAKIGGVSFEDDAMLSVKR